jgi:hypothetical protein
MHTSILSTFVLSAIAGFAAAKPIHSNATHSFTIGANSSYATATAVYNSTICVCESAFPTGTVDVSANGSAFATATVVSAGAPYFYNSHGGNGTVVSTPFFPNATGSPVANGTFISGSEAYPTSPVTNVSEAYPSGPATNASEANPSGPAISDFPSSPVYNASVFPSGK